MFQLSTQMSFFLALLLAQGSTKIEKLTEQKLITKLVGNSDGTKLENYDWRIRPFGGHNFGQGGTAVRVRVNLYLRTISKVDDVDMEYSLHFTFREEWVDERLEYKNSDIQYLNLSPGQKIWMPDTFFQNEKDGRKHNIDTPNVLLRVYVNDGGRILYSVRMTLTLSCPMDLQNYPMDHQECFIDLASYAYTTRDIIYFFKDTNPVQIKKGLRSSLPSFSLGRVKTANCTSVTNTGTYSCLRTIIILRRQFSYYLLQLYIPSFMLVAVSWVSFWLDKDSVPARVTLGVTTLLTMSTQSGGVNAKLPPVSYTKAIDVWIGVCLAFIFGALLEFALVNYFAREDARNPIRQFRNGKKPTVHTLPSLFRTKKAKPMMDVECNCSYSAENNNVTEFLNTSDSQDYQEPPLLCPESFSAPRKSWVDKYWRGKYKGSFSKYTTFYNVLYK